MNHETRHNRFEVLYNNITRRTNGNIIFREQMESALVSLGGFSVRHVHTIMRAILKKQTHRITAYYLLFRANLLGAYPEKDIDQLWESIVLSPALVETGALCNHFAHGEGYSSDCGVCFAIKNKFPVHPTIVMSGEGFKPGSLDDKTRHLNIDVVLGLLERYKKEEKVLADSNVIVIDNMATLDGLPADLGKPGFPDLDNFCKGEFRFDMLRPKGEPLSAAAKDVLAKTYIKPKENSPTVIKKTETPQEEGLKRGVMHSYIGRLPGCTCRDGEDHDLCPACHEHSMRGMKKIAEDLGVCIVTAQQKKDQDRWIERYMDGGPKGEPIKDYDLHHTNGERLMRMRTGIKPLKEVEKLLGVTAVQHVGQPSTPTVTDLVTEDDLAQKEIVEPEVCKCNIWAGCTCGVMERERASKAKEEG